MDAHEYAALRARPNVMRRADLRATLARLTPGRPDLAAKVAGLLRSAPVPKPDAHAGGPETDLLWLALPGADCEAIADALADVEVSLVQADAAPGPVGAAADLHDLWRRAREAGTPGITHRPA